MNTRQAVTGDPSGPRLPHRYARGHPVLIGLALVALVSLFASNPASAQTPPAPSISLTGGTYPHEIKVSWTWSAGSSTCRVDDYYCRVQEEHGRRHGTRVWLDHERRKRCRRRGLPPLMDSFGSSTSISSSFTIGPRAKWRPTSSDGEVGVTLADVDYDVRMYVYSETVPTAIGVPTAVWRPASRHRTSCRPSAQGPTDPPSTFLTLTQGTAMTAVTLPAATGGNRSVYYSISPDLPAGLSASQSDPQALGHPDGNSIRNDLHLQGARHRLQPRRRATRTRSPSKLPSTHRTTPRRRR